MLIAVFSILGIVLGATLQYVFSQFLEDRKHKRLLQTQAYADFLRSIAEAAHFDSTVSEAQVHAKIADARARIALYGSSKVVRELAEFERAGNAIISQEQHAAFIRLIQVMRGDDKVQSAELELVVLGSNEARPANTRLERTRR
jgi:hypothetical protein